MTGLFDSFPGMGMRIECIILDFPPPAKILRADPVANIPSCICPQNLDVPTIIQISIGRGYMHFGVYPHMRSD